MKQQDYENLRDMPNGKPNFIRDASKPMNVYMYGITEPLKSYMTPHAWVERLDGFFAATKVIEDSLKVPTNSRLTDYPVTSLNFQDDPLRPRPDQTPYRVRANRNRGSLLVSLLNNKTGNVVGRIGTTVAGKADHSQKLWRGLCSQGAGNKKGYSKIKPQMSWAWLQVDSMPIARVPPSIADAVMDFSWAWRLKIITDSLQMNSQEIRDCFREAVFDIDAGLTKMNNRFEQVPLELSVFVKSRAGNDAPAM